MVRLMITKQMHTPKTHYDLNAVRPADPAMIVMPGLGEKRRLKITISVKRLSKSYDVGRGAACDYDLARGRPEAEEVQAGTPVTIGHPDPINDGWLRVYPHGSGGVWWVHFTEIEDL